MSSPRCARAGVALLALLLVVLRPCGAGCPDDKGLRSDCGDLCAKKPCAAGEQCRLETCGQCAAVCEPAGTMHIMAMPSVPVQQPVTSQPPARGSLQRPPAAAPVPKPAVVRSGQQPPGTAAETPCAPGVPAVRCFADPCASTSCKSGQVCVASYCGACSAVCSSPAAVAAGCARGTGWDVGARKCVACKPGSVSDGASGLCLPCPADSSYMPMRQAGMATCLPCPPGKGTNGRTGQARCV